MDEVVVAQAAYRVGPFLRDPTRGFVSGAFGLTIPPSSQRRILTYLTCVTENLPLSM